MTESEQMQIETIKKIADNLERIGDSLEKLAECVDTNYAHSWLNVSGTVENYER